MMVPMGMHRQISRSFKPTMMRNTFPVYLLVVVTALLFVDTVAFVACLHCAPRKSHDQLLIQTIRFPQPQTTSLRLAAASDDEDETNMFPDDDCLDLCPDWENEPSFTSITPNPQQQQVDDTTTTTTISTKKKKPSSFQRMMRLEMTWELRQNQEDCNVEEIETCGDYCVDCVGVGFVKCRFCHGEGKLHLPTTAMYGTSPSCPVCNPRGTEVCKTCRGSGRVADWTSYSTSN